MRLAFYFDNRGIASLGPLPDPGLGNPGIGGTEYALLAVVRLLQGSEIEPVLFLTQPQIFEGISTPCIDLVADLSEAIDRSAALACVGLVFRPGFATEADWDSLEQSRVPLVLWLSNLGCDQLARYERLRSVSRWVLLSGAQVDAFRHSRLAQRAVVIPYPVAVPLAQQQPRSLQEARSATDLAYVGALTPFKGFDRLARQWSMIARQCPQAHLRVFGGSDLYGTRALAGKLSPYEIHCRELLEQGGYANRVVFEGSCGLERYGSFASVAVGVVNPSGRDETFCLAAAEFSACGIPVVAPRRHVFVQTVLDQQTGLLASSDHSLAASAVELLQDPERAWRLGAEGQRSVQQRFSTECVRKGWVELAKELSVGAAVTPIPVSTPWWHEQRWLRQLWGMGLALPGWPSWPECKIWIKRWLQGGGELRPAGIAVIAGLVALLLWAGLVFGKFGGNPSGLVRIGERFPTNPHLPREQLVVIPGKRGNDGQQFLVLATDPLQLDAATPQAVDNPVYRGKRLLYPLLAWVTGLGQPHLIVWTLGLVNVACIACAAGLVAQWALLEQLSPRWGLAVLVLPAYWITFTLSTADLLATTLLLAAAVAWRQQRPAWLSAALTAAVLSRETALLVWGASLLAAVTERRWRWLLPLAVVPVPLLVLTTWLKMRFAASGDGLLAVLHFGMPGLGILQKLGQLLGPLPVSGLAPSGLERGFDGLCLLLWLCSVAILAATAQRGWGGRWLRITAGVYLLPALCSTTQILARFPDYTRVWIDVGTLALLALLSARSRWLLPWLATSTLVSLGYWTGYSVLAP